MKSLYNVNSLVHWNEREIETRERAVRYLSQEIQSVLKGINRAWEFERIEAPIMLPRDLVNPNYSDDDLWVFNRHDDSEPELVARPETTAGTYAWMVDKLASQASVRLPWCVWQTGKSFRAERDNVLKNMRLKEFYQMEFQCAYGADTANDYQVHVLEPMRKMLSAISGLPARIVESDRLPSYSLCTMDIEVNTGERWMEVCSISKRTDFPVPFRYQNKKKEFVEVQVFVLEIAVGLDRLIYAWNLATS
jgi:glycyl-tRNA synthetase